MKITRSNFLKTSLSLAGIIATSQSPAVLVKSMLANRSNITNEYDENNFPYVSRGLVSIWDGIWNSGVEIHSDDSNDFIDLVSGKNILVGNYGTNSSTEAPWTVEWNGVRSNSINQSESVGIALPNVTQYSMPWIFELVFTVHNFHNIQDAVPLWNYIPYVKNGHHSLYVGSYSQDYYKYIKMMFSGEWRLKSPLFWKIGLNTISFGKHNATEDEGAVRAFVNGGFEYGGGVRYYMVPNGVTHRVLCTPPGFDATLHCIRIYNDWLTPDEVSYNHEIDKMRFNLP